VQQETHHQRRRLHGIKLRSKLYCWYEIPSSRRNCSCQTCVLSECAERIKAFNPTPSKPFVLGLPTGSSPELIYKSLVQKYKNGEISFKNVITFNMVRLPCHKIIVPYSALSEHFCPSTNQTHEQSSNVQIRMNMSASRSPTQNPTTPSCTRTFSATSTYLLTTSTS
jgi:hypothetical protein